MDNKYKNEFESESEEIMDTSIISDTTLQKTSPETTEISANKSLSDIAVKSATNNNSDKDTDLKSQSSLNLSKKNKTILAIIIIIALIAVSAYFLIGRHKADHYDNNSKIQVEQKEKDKPSDSKPEDPAAADKDKEFPDYMPAEQAQDENDYSDLTEDCFFKATAFCEYAGDDNYVLFTGSQVTDIMGQPERKENWTYQGQNGDYEVTSYYYNIDNGKNGSEPTLNFVFYNNVLMEIIVLEPIKFNNIDNLLSQFGLKKTAESQVLIDNDEQYRVTNCGIRDFWAYAIEYSADKSNNKAYCYLRYLEL